MRASGKPSLRAYECAVTRRTGDGHAQNINIRAWVSYRKPAPKHFWNFIRSLNAADEFAKKIY